MIALLLLALGPTSSLDAAAQVRQLLMNFGVRGPFRLQELGQAQASAQSVAYSVGDGSRYQAYWTSTGSLFALYREKESDNYLREKTHPVSDSKSKRRATDWLHAAGTKESVRLYSLIEDGKGFVQADFRILRNGYPFVASIQHYGYRITFKGGQFRRYEGQENPPPVDPAPALLDEKAALGAFKKVFDEEIIPSGREHGWKMSYQFFGARELGYYLPPGEARARLVWRVPYMSMRDTGYALQGGDNAMLIDARTGKRLLTNVVP